MKKKGFFFDNFKQKQGPGLQKFAKDNHKLWAGSDADDQKEFKALWKRFNSDVPFPFKDDGSYVAPKVDDKKGKEPKYRNTCKGAFTLPGMMWGAGQSQPVSATVQALKKFKHAVKIGVLKAAK